MTGKIHKILIALALCSCTAARGQECDSLGVLSIDDCVELALGHNRDIQAAKLREDQYRYTRLALRGNFFPKVYVQANDIWDSTSGEREIDVATPVADYATRRMTELLPLVASSSAGAEYLSSIAGRLQELNPLIGYNSGNLISVMAMLEQPVYMGGKITSAYKMGRLGEKMAGLGVGISEDETVLRTYEAYSLVVKAKEMSVVAQQYDSLLVIIKKTADAAIRNGMASNADMMKVDAELSRSALQLRQASNGLRLAKMNLCHVMGLPMTSVFDVETMDSSAVCDAFEADVTGRKEYEALKAKTELAEYKVKLERSNFLPEVGVAVGGGYLNGIRIMGENVFDNDLHAMAVVNVKIPVFHGAEGRYKVLSAKSEAEQARLEQENLCEMMRLEIQKTADELDEARLAADLSESLLRKAEENLRTSRKAYENGMGTVSDLLQAQTEWQNAYAEMIDARHQSIIKEISWRKAAGILNKHND